MLAFTAAPQFLASIGESVNDSFLQEAALWALRSIPGFPPIIQTVHILGIAAVMGTLVWLNLRTLGFANRSQQLAEMTARVMPWFWLAMAVNVISGAFFVFGRPMRYFSNPVFAWKLSFLLPALLMALAVHLMNRKEAGFWETSSQRLWASRAMAVASLLCILAVCTAGRWIAYLEYIQYPLWSMEPYIDDTATYSFWVAIENWPLSQLIAATNWFPTLETVHIIAATLVLGSLLWVDLRLLGLGANQYPITILHSEGILWTWGAFVVAAATGVAMLITRVSSHIENPAFLWKMALLTLAGANMAWFQFRLHRQLANWDTHAETPRQLKLAGGLSLLLWSGVMLAGRWIGHIV